MEGKRHQNRIKVKEAIAFTAMQNKKHYNRRHTAMFLKQGDFCMLRLHRGYRIPSHLNNKLTQQYMGPFQVLEKIGRLAYCINISADWKIHPVISIAHLEPCLKLDSDPYRRSKFTEPPKVHMNLPFEINRLLDH